MSELDKFRILLNELQTAWYNVCESGGDTKQEFEKVYEEKRHAVELMFIHALHP